MKSIRLIPIFLFAFAQCAFSQSTQVTPSQQQAGTQAVSDNQIRFYADVAIKTAKAFEIAKTQARQAAQSYEQIAEMKCRQSMASNPEYRDASQQRDSAQRVLSEAHQLNNPQLAADASSQYNKAAEKVKQIEDKVMSTDVDVLAARSVLAKIDPPPSVPVVVHEAAVKQVPVAIPAKPLPTSKHRPIPTRIEIGMSRDDLMWFLKRNNRNYRITRDNASRPVNSSVEQVRIRSQNAETSVVDGQSGSRIAQGVNNQQVEKTVVSNKTEHMTVQVLQWQPVVIGQERDPLGGLHQVTERQLVPVSQINVTLVDDVVTGVDGAIQ